MANDTIDLRRLFAKQKSEEDDAAKKEENSEETTETENPETSDEEKSEEENSKAEDDSETEDEAEDDKKGPKIALKDWEDELEKRIKENALKDSSHKKSEGEVRNAFWEDYFNANWNSKVAAKLKRIDLLRKDIEDIGFDPLINPLLAFLLRHYVQKLVLEDLINGETFKALNNAVADNYLADSEFVKENAYNILYCRDLYKQPIRDIVEYLRLQKSVLKPNAPAYNKETRTTNIKIFLENGFTSVLDDGAKLNSLDEVKSYLKGKGFSTAKSEDTDDSDNTDTTSEDETSTDTSGTSSKKTVADEEKLKEIVSEMSSAEALAALQYIGIHTRAKSALEAIKKVPKNENIKDVMDATQKVANYFKGLKLDKAARETLIGLLVDELNS
jgi:hypothetical protein